MQQYLILLYRNALVTKRHITEISSCVIGGKGKVLSYLLPSTGPGADPGVQAVSPQVGNFKPSIWR